MKNNKKKLSVSVIIPTRNASTTVVSALESVVKQTYPIQEIIVVDNVSKDNSRGLVLAFSKKSKIPVRLIKQERDKGVSSSNNLGTKNAKSDLVVFMMSDCILPTQFELEKLVKPLTQDHSVIATFPTTILPREIWNNYNFWQKMYMISDLDNNRPLMNAKFDCVRKDVFSRVGGYDEQNFGGDSSIGGEDAELSLRLQKEGRVVPSDAKIIHLHYMGKDYSLGDIFKSRKLYARTYARLLRKRGHLFPLRVLVFLIKPAIALLPFLPHFFVLGVMLLIAYSFAHTRKMFTTSLTLADPRILLLPFLNIFLLYYDTFWMIEAFFILPLKYSIIKK